MRVGTIVKDDRNHLAIFLYPHDENPNKDTICSILNRWNKRIKHVPFGEINLYENICWSCQHRVFSDVAATCPVCHWVICPECGACKKSECIEDGIYIYDLESWHEINGVITPKGEGNYYVNMDNHELVYTGKIFDMVFEENVEALIEEGYDPILVIDLERRNVFIYADNGQVKGVRDVILEMCGVRKEDIFGF